MEHAWGVYMAVFTLGGARLLRSSMTWHEGSRSNLVPMNEPVKGINPRPWCMPDVTGMREYLSQPTLLVWRHGRQGLPTSHSWTRLEGGKRSS